MTYTIRVRYGQPWQGPAGSQPAGYLVKDWWSADSNTAYVRTTWDVPYPTWTASELAAQIGLLPLRVNNLDLTAIEIRGVPVHAEETP